MTAAARGYVLWIVNVIFAVILGKYYYSLFTKVTIDIDRYSIYSNSFFLGSYQKSTCYRRVFSRVRKQTLQKIFNSFFIFFKARRRGLRLPYSANRTLLPNLTIRASKTTTISHRSHLRLPSPQITGMPEIITTTVITETEETIRIDSKSQWLNLTGQIVIIIIGTIGIRIEVVSVKRKFYFAYNTDNSDIKNIAFSDTLCISIVLSVFLGHPIYLFCLFTSFSLDSR